MAHSSRGRNKHRLTTRRDFIKLINGVAAGWAIGESPLVNLVRQPQPPVDSKVTYRVAVGRVETYDFDLVLRQMSDLLDRLDGFQDVVTRGAKVAIKVNLTAGTEMTAAANVPAIESYVTHPMLVEALGQLLRDAGVNDIYIVESVFDDKSFAAFGYKDVARKLDATLVDLNNPSPYQDFDTVPVGERWYIYQDFALHPILQEVDAFISVAKMKCHFACGVSLSLKNLIGLAPVSRYRLDPKDNWRSALHGSDFSPDRIPRVVVDINRARPINLAIIDGIKAAEGGEIPHGSFAPVTPGLMMIGKNALATDAVTTAIMGFDPRSAYPNKPFFNGISHLNLAYARRLGSNRLDEIDVVGLSIEEALYPFKPATSQGELTNPGL